MLEFDRLLNAGNKPEWKDGSATIATMEQLSQHLALLNGVSHSTIWKWYSRFKRQGFSGLHRPQRADKGRSLFFVRHFRSAAFVIELSVKSGRSAFSIHNELLRSGEDAPSYNTTREFVKSLRSRQRKTR
jgi:hypothetical protein